MTYEKTTDAVKVVLASASLVLTMIHSGHQGYRADFAHL